MDRNETLVKIHNTLEQMSVSGKQNWLILVTVLNELEKLIKEDKNGNVHNES